tara:strand:- start:195 stop:1406 length:1212 start_codon:yes stop_codon:yes gene_type:complete
MKKILLVISLTILILSSASAAEKVNIEKQLIGIIGAISGNVKTETRELKTGDKIYLNETILAGADSGTQILLLDQSTFTIGSDSEVVMDTFIYDPDTNDGKIIAEVKQGSLKVISGLISKKNPDSLTVKVPEGTLGSRGTEFQTMVSKKQTSTLLIGPGKNNTLGLRPGAVLVGNKLGSTLLNNPYSITTMQKGKAPGQAKKITKGQLKKFNKKMKALKVAKLEGVSKNEKKKIKAGIKKELEAAGLEKAEIKVLIKENIKKDKKKKAEKKKAIAKKKKAKKKNANLKNDKGKNKKANAKNKKKNKKKKAKAKKNKNNKKKKSNAKNKKNNKKKKSKAKNKKKNKSKAKAKNTKKNKPKPKAKNTKKNKPKPKAKSNKKKNKKKNKNKNKNKNKKKNKNKNKN